jgi:hypothetical protein
MDDDLLSFREKIEIAGNLGRIRRGLEPIRRPKDLDEAPEARWDIPVEDLSEDALREFIRVCHPEFLHYLDEDDPDSRPLLQALYVEHKRGLNLGWLMALPETLSEFRSRLAGKVRCDLGGFLQGDGDLPDELAGRAIRKVLGIPEGEAVEDGGQYDTPEYHEVLMQPVTQDDMVRWVVGRLIDQGACPDLEYVFGRSTDDPDA